MNKYLREIEIAASDHFGEKNARQFVDDTRPIVDGAYQRLKKTIRSKYGKVAVILWPQSVLDEYSLPRYQFDSMSGVCMINYPYDLNDYLKEDNRDIRNEIVFGIFEKAFKKLPDEMGLDGASVIEFLANLSRDISN